VWRNIASEPVATRPLALCDAHSVGPEDRVVFEIHYADRIGENYFARHREDHRWYFYPALIRDEALLIKQWDSSGELARYNGARGDTHGDGAPSTFSFHSAFEDPTTPPDAPERWSIEVRCVPCSNEWWINGTGTLSRSRPVDFKERHPDGANRRTQTGLTLLIFHSPQIRVDRPLWPDHFGSPSSISITRML
jgi:hypothetical protein